MSLEDVRVHHRSGQWCPGVRTGDGVVAYDLPVLPPWQVPGRPTTDRCYVLGAAGIQLTRPGTFTGALEGGWYVDVVEPAEAGPRRLVVHDLYVDVIVLPGTRRYEVLDLDELADALQDGRIDAATAARALRSAQRFIDGHLRDLDRAAPDSWPDFPPAAIRPLIELPPFGP